MARKPTVADFLAALEHPHKPAIEALRSLILAIDPRISERIKWNAPSFALSDDFATFKLRPAETIQIVLHPGARPQNPGQTFAIDDPHGLLRWAAPDRALVTFADAADAAAKADPFRAIVRAWIGRLESAG